MSKPKIYKDKECLVCGKMFTPRTGLNKTCKGFCTDELRRFRDRERDKKSRPEKERTCPFCKSVFKTRDGKRKYCFSSQCNARSLYEKNRRAQEKRKGKRTEYKKNHYQENRDVILARKKLEYRLARPGEEVKDGWTTVKNTFEEVKFYISSRGYTLKSDQYINNQEKIDILCPEEHLWSVSYHNFKDLGQNCPECQKWKFQSKPELEIVSHFKGNYPELIVDERNNSEIGVELDIYFPEKKVAVEYCGLYWHGEVSAGKTPIYHRDKLNKCMDKGIRLITIFEDEYLSNRDVVLSRIENALGLINKKVYARKCELKELNRFDYLPFFERYHLQGRAGAKVCFGLLFEGQLIQALSLGSLSRTHAGEKGQVIELKRLASVPGISVVGGSSKLFSAAKKWSLLKGYRKIKSYCDMRWANSNKPIYEVLGFYLERESIYTPHYFRGQKRYRNQSLRKTPEERRTGKTEWQLRQEQGYDRIWDCGHRTYVYDL